MKKDNDQNDVIVANQALDLILGENKNPRIYSHAVFCQCTLPLRALPKEKDFYQAKHGNTSLIMQAGILISDSGQAHKMEVPSGAKARLLFPYIIDQAKRTGNPVIDMGKNLYDYMIRNNIPIGGSNAKEITRQIHNIAASNIYLGMWGENENHKFSTQENYRVSSNVSFWNEKNPDQLSIWNPCLTVSNEFMAAIENHCVLLDLKPLVELQANPRSMDLYMWLIYRIHTVRYPVKISYESLHSVFGQQTKELHHFKAEFKKAIKQALPYIPQADVDLESDSKHVILKNTSYSIFLPSGKVDKSVLSFPNPPLPEVSGVFGNLKAIGLSVPVIEKITKQYEPEAIKKAAKLTQQNLESGTLTNPPGFFRTALEEGWEPVSSTESETDKKADVKTYDTASEAKIKPVAWRKVRKELYNKLGEGAFASWIMGLQYGSEAKGNVELKASTKFIAEWVNNNYLEKIQTAWEEVTGEDVAITVQVTKVTEPA